MTRATAIGAEVAERIVESQTGTRRRLRPRHLWLVPGFAMAIFANLLGSGNGIGIPELVAFGIAPDLPRLLGSRARGLHNLLHRPVLAGVAVAVAATGYGVLDGVLPVIWLVGSLVWLGHVVVGWAVGDVPRPQEVRGDA